MKNRKKMIITGCGCLVAGLMACGISSALGGSQVLQSPMLWIEIGPNSGMGFWMNDSKSDVVSSEIAIVEQEAVASEGDLGASAIVSAQTDQTIKEVHITTPIGSLNLEQGQNAEVQSNLPELFKKKDGLQLRQNTTNGIWKLELDQRGAGFNLPNPDLDIVIPESVKTVYIECGVGELTLAGLNLESLKIDTSAANVQLRNCMLDSLDANLSMGDLSLSGCSVNRMETDLSAGGLNMDTTKINRSLDANLSAGGADLSLIGNLSNYNLDLNVAAGLITVDHDTSYDSYLKSYPNASVQIQINASMGEIQLNFEGQKTDLSEQDELVQEQTSAR